MISARLEKINGKDLRILLMKQMKAFGLLMVREGFMVRRTYYQ